MGPLGWQATGARSGFGNRGDAMSDQDKPFWQQPMRIMDLALEDSHGSWLNRWTPAQIVETAVQMDANVLNMLVVNEWGQAYWPSPHLPMHPELRGEDRLGDNERQS